MVFPAHLRENEFICLFFVKTDKEGNSVINSDGEEVKFHKYVKNFEQYQECISRYMFNYHVYNALATVKLDKNGELHRRESNMRQRKVLFIDFDKKDYPNFDNVTDYTKMIKDRLPDTFLHAYYDSGHGYHFYIVVNPTCNIRELTNLNKEICELVDADTNACKVTQVARVPGTFNRKYLNYDGKFPMVKEIDHYKNHEYSRQHFHPCNIGYIKRRVADAKNKIESELESKHLKRWNYSGDGINFTSYPCLCTEKVLHEGADKTQRNTWLGRIISMLKNQGYTDAKIRDICLDWNTRCRPPKNVAAIRNEISTYLDKADIYKLNGCWESIPNERVRDMVRMQCDKIHCMQSIQKKNITIEENIGVKMSQKLLSNSRLKRGAKSCMDGYEYLIMTILYKYIKNGSRRHFTVKDLKMKLQWKKSGKWQLCMDIETLKNTLSKLQEHGCIEIVEPVQQESKKRITFDDNIIKIKRGIKVLNDKYIEFYYSTARAFISKQITKNEFKVFLCIVNNIKEGKSCTMEDLDNILQMGKSNIVESIRNLQIAQCIDVVHQRSDKGKYYNMYSQKYTDRYDEKTYNDEIVVDIPNKIKCGEMDSDGLELIAKIVV